MIIQQILKGIGNIDELDADRILTQTGIESNWIRNSSVDLSDWSGRLTDEELEWHLNRFDDHYPATGGRYSQLTPFISTTAGVYERDPDTADIVPFDPIEVAISFATNEFSRDGFVFHGYVFILERPSIPLVGFAEEVRSLTSFPWYMPYHHEGEITAKIHIPACQLEKYERYDVTPDGGCSLVGSSPDNPSYRSPWEFCNVRGLAALPALP